MKIFCNLFLMAGVAIAIHYTNARYLLVEVTDEKEVGKFCLASNIKSTSNMAIIYFSYS